MTNFYITNGTLDFMKRFYSKNKDVHNLFFLLDGQYQAVTLFQETNQKTVFGNPRRYEVINGFGHFVQSGAIMIKHITVEKEDQAYFENRFESYIEKSKMLPGLLALRFLRPKKGPDYVIFTAWLNSKYTEDWEIPEEYLVPSSQVLHGDIFNIPTFTKKYWLPTKEDIEERFIYSQ